MGGGGAQPAHDIVSMLSKLLDVCTDMPGVLNGINGTLYAILTRPALKQRAQTLGFDEQLASLIERCTANAAAAEGAGEEGDAAAEGGGGGGGGGAAAEEDGVEKLGEDEQRQFEFVRQQLNAVQSDELQSGDDEDEDEDEEDEEAVDELRAKMGEAEDTFRADPGRSEVDGETLLLRDYAAPLLEATAALSPAAMARAAAGAEQEWGAEQQQEIEYAQQLQQQQQQQQPQLRGQQQPSEADLEPQWSERTPFNEDVPASVADRKLAAIEAETSAAVDPRLAQQAQGLSLGRGTFQTTRVKLEQQLPTELQSRPRIPRSRGSTRSAAAQSEVDSYSPVAMQPMSQQQQQQQPPIYSGSARNAAMGLARERGAGAPPVQQRFSPLPVYPTNTKSAAAAAAAAGVRSPIRPHDHENIIGSSSPTTGPTSVKPESQLSSVDVLHARLGEEIGERWSSLRESFLKVDADRSGGVTHAELINVLRQDSYVFADGDIKMLLNRYDADGNGIITFDEFAAMMTNAPQLQ